MTNANDAFLKAYKELEQAIGSDATLPVNKVPDYEMYLESTDKDRADRIRFCRSMRNYIQHHADGLSLVAIQPPLVKFLESETAEIKSHGDHVKDHLIKVPAITVKSSLKEVLDLMTSKKVSTVILENKDGSIGGAFTTQMILDAAVKSDWKLASKASSVCPAAAVKRELTALMARTLSPADDWGRMSLYPAGTIALVTSTGDETGTYRGLVKRQD